MQVRLSAERLWLPVLAPHPVFSWELGRPLSHHPAILGPRAGLVLNPRMSVSVVSVILTAESQLYRKKGDNLLRTHCVLGTFVHIILIPITAMLKRYCYTYFMSRKYIQSRERFRFYPKPPNKQMLILVIRAHFSDCWEPGSQQCHWRGRDSETG